MKRVGSGGPGAAPRMNSARGGWRRYRRESRRNPASCPGFTRRVTTTTSRPSSPPMLSLLPSLLDHAILASAPAHCNSPPIQPRLPPAAAVRLKSANAAALDTTDRLWEGQGTRYLGKFRHAEPRARPASAPPHIARANPSRPRHQNSAQTNSSRARANPRCSGSPGGGLARPLDTRHGGRRRLA